MFLFCNLKYAYSRILWKQRTTDSYDTSANFDVSKNDCVNRILHERNSVKAILRL